MAGRLSFLILGAGRGGTSLLAGLLDAHPALEVGFEHRSSATLLARKLPEGLPHDLDGRARAFLAAGRREAARHPGARWGNKITTEQLRGLEEAAPDLPTDEVLDRFFNDWLAGVPVVFVLRDGRTCVRSKVERTGQPVEQAMDRWRFSVDVWRFLRDRHVANHRLKFEDLLADPEPVLEDVCDFLNLPFHRAMLGGTASRKMRSEYRRDHVDVSRAGLDGVPAGVEEALRPELAECGYLEDPTVAPR